MLKYIYIKLPLYTFALLLNSANIVAAIFIEGGILNVATAGKRIYIKFGLFWLYCCTNAFCLWYERDTLECVPENETGKKACMSC